MMHRTAVSQVICRLRTSRSYGAAEVYSHYLLPKRLSVIAAPVTMAMVMDQFSFPPESALILPGQQERYVSL